MTHAAVDDEVERITERDEHVDEESGHLARLGIDQIDIHRVLNDEHYITSNHPSEIPNEQCALSCVQETFPFLRRFLVFERFQQPFFRKNVVFPCEIPDMFFFQRYPGNFSILSVFFSS